MPPPQSPPSAARGTRGTKTAGKRKRQGAAAVAEGKVVGAAAAAGGGPPSEQRPIIFLDVDGVLVRFGGAEEDADATRREANAAAALRQALASLASIVASQQLPPRLVLSSTWRCSPPAVEELRAHFKAFGPPLSALTLDETTSLAEHSHRRWEIASWLLANNNGANAAPFVILDDDAPEPPADEDGVHTDAHQQCVRELADKVVAPESHVGLTAEDANAAIAVLARAGGGGGGGGGERVAAGRGEQKLSALAAMLLQAHSTRT